MDIRKVKKLIELLEESSLSEIEIREGEETVRISRASQISAPVAAYPPAQIPAAPPPPEVEAAPPESISGTPIISPMVGTFYRSPSPGDPPFVEEGDAVKQGDALCIIEAMKMMNHIDASTTGTVKKILLKDGDPVEFGQTLMYLE